MPSPKPKYREVTEPAISANQLAQYLSAGPAARKRIITNARWQSRAVVTRYKLARSAIATCLCDLTKSPTTFAAQRAALEKKLSTESNSAWTVADLEASIEALDRYRDTLNKTNLNSFNCQTVASSPPPLIIEKLRVKVTPDVTVHRTGTNGAAPKIGAIVTLVAKGESSTTKRREQSRVAATLVWLFAEKHLKNLGEPARDLCLSYDVFEGLLTPATGPMANRLANIQAACAEIFLAWPSATPPADVDEVV